MVAARRPPRRWTLAVLLLAFLALAAVGSVSRFYTDLLWFREIDKASLFWGMLRTKTIIGLLAGLGTAAIVGVNLWMVERLAPRYGLSVVARPQVERARAVLSPYLRPLRLGIAAFLGLVVGLQASGLWQTFLLWRNRVPFGQRDALFNRDVSFYMFELPFQRAVFGWLFTTLVLTTLLVAAGHYVLGGIRPQAETNRIAAQAQSHLCVLLGLIVALKAWGYWLDKYQLLFSPRGVVAGASYTDVKAQLPALEVLFWVALICGAAFFVGARRGGLLIPTISIVLLAGVSLILGGIIPAVFQRFRVEPQELARERPYIEKNIDATNKSFNLSGVSIKEFPASNALTPTALQANRPTLDNIRLWDPEVLRPGVRNLQAIAQYYNFTDVDVDRYKIGDDNRQVMISVREVDPNGLAESARTWQNLHLAYTHGYGFVAVQVNTAAEGGQPDFIVSGFNPQDPAIEVDQPRVYFGEPPPNSPEFVVANSAQGEYDAQGGQRDQPVQLRRHRGRAALRRRPPAGLRRPLPRHQPAHLRQHQGRVAPDVQPRHPRAGRAGGPVPPVGRRPLRGGGRRPHQVRPRRLHHLQQLPLRPAHRPGRRRPPQRAGQPRGRGDRQLHPQLGQGRGRRLHRRGHPVRLRRAGPHPRRLAQGVPRPVRGQGRDPREPQQPTCATRRTCSPSRPGSTPATTSATRTSSTPRRTSGPCPTTAPARSAARRTPAAWPPPPRSRPAPTTS